MQSSQVASLKERQAARTAIVSAVWGSHMHMRCVEIVIGRMHDPTKIDPPLQF